MLRAIVGSIIAAALVGVASALTGSFGDTSWRLLGTIGLFVFFALCSWYDADVSGKRSAAFGFTSIGVSILLLVIGVQKLWLGTSGEGDLLRWLWVAAVGRVALLHVHLLLTNKRRFTTPTMQRVTIGTIALVAVLATMLSVPFVVVQPDYPEGYWRVVVAVAILDLLGTVLIPLVFVLFHSATATTTAGGSDRPPQTSPAPATRPGTLAPMPPVGAGEHGGPTRPAADAWQHQAPSEHEHRAPVAAPVMARPTGLAGSLPPAGAYPALTVPYLLEWPRYINGQPLPVGRDGTPDFTGVQGYSG